jgi:hypothetical protein
VRGLCGDGLLPQLRAGGRALPDLAGMMRQGWRVWVAWPRKASAIPGDPTMVRIRQMASGFGLVDYRVCAVDETRSAMTLGKWRQRGFCRTRCLLFKYFSTILERRSSFITFSLFWPIHPVAGAARCRFSLRSGKDSLGRLPTCPVRYSETNWCLNNYFGVITQAADTLGRRAKSLNQAVGDCPAACGRVLPW